VVLQLQSTTASFISGYNGSMNVGPKIDDVSVTNTTDDVVLFEDDFEEEMENSGVVACPTPDPDDSKAAIPLASMEPCEKFSKIALAFPQNLYLVAAFEFNPSGSGFSACLKAWLCNPEAEVVDEEELPSGLVAYWAHDEASGDVLDSHTGEHDLTEFGDGTLGTGSGKISSARTYPTGTVATGADASWNQLQAVEFTICGWAKIDTMTVATLFSKGQIDSTGGYYCTIDRTSETEANFSFQIGSIPVSVAISEWNTEDWLFWCVRFDPVTNNIYLSYGVGTTLVHAAGEVAGDIAPNPTDPFTLGGYIDEFDALLNSMAGGSLDEVSLWDNVLTEEYVATIFNNGAGVGYSSLVL
jgi:hypothetical protein